MPASTLQQFVRATLAKLKRAPRDPQTGDLVEQFRLTDIGNGERFLANHGEDFRFCGQLGGWFSWDGARWRRDLSEQAIQRMKATMGGLWAEAKAHAGRPDVYAAIVSHAKRSASAGKVEAALKMARATDGVACEPSSFDGPRTDGILNVRNGIVDLSTGELREHDRDLLITRCCGTALEPDAKAPRWLRFLDEVFEGDQELIDWLQCFLGYSFTGYTSEQIFLVAHGAGSNGKSTLVETLEELAGEYSLALDPRALLAQKHGKHSGSASPEIARLRGARLAFACESDEGEQLNESLVKQLTGGDTLSARHLNAEFFDFVPRFQLWMSTNHRPQVRTGSVGLWRRIRLIPFERRFEGATKEVGLKDRLAAELPGILAWIVRGAVAWHQAGRRLPDPPERGRRAGEDYRAEENPLSRFLSQHCDDVADGALARETLRARYVAWFHDLPEHERPGQRPFSARRFYELVSAFGYEQRKRRGSRYFMGLKLKEAA